MADTTPEPPLRDPAPKSSVDHKVIAAALFGGVLVPALLAVATYVLANQDVLGINNPVLGTLVFSLIGGLATFLAGYVKRDPVREVGARRALVE